MKSSAKKVELASVDDLFSTEESRADAQREKVLEIPLSELHEEGAGVRATSSSFWKFPCRSCTRSRTTPLRSRMTRP